MEFSRTDRLLLDGRRRSPGNETGGVLEERASERCGDAIAWCLCQQTPPAPAPAAAAVTVTMTLCAPSHRAR